jgi:arylsulfatase A-like enzyme
LVDLHATLADLCGLKAPNDLDGVSLKPLLENPSAEWTRAARTQVATGGGKKASMGRSVRTEEYRYTEWGDDGADGKQLYHYPSDPHELKNLAAEPMFAEIVKRMKGQLRGK